MRMHTTFFFVQVFTLSLWPVTRCHDHDSIAPMWLRAEKALASFATRAEGMAPRLRGSANVTAVAGTREPRLRGSANMTAVARSKVEVATRLRGSANVTKVAGEKVSATVTTAGGSTKNLRGLASIAAASETSEARKSLRGLPRQRIEPASEQITGKSLIELASFAAGTLATGTWPHRSHTEAERLQGSVNVTTVADAKDVANLTMASGSTKNLRGPARTTTAQSARKSLRGLDRHSSEPASHQTVGKSLTELASFASGSLATGVWPHHRPATHLDFTHRAEPVLVDATAKIQPASEKANMHDTEAVHSGTVVLSGNMRIDVPEPQAFLEDTAARERMKQGIAHILGIRAQYISLDVSWSGSMLVTTSLEPMRHIDRSVDVYYTITLEPHLVVSPMSLVYTFNSQPQEEIAFAIQAELDAAKGPGYSISVIEHEISMQ